MLRRSSPTFRLRAGIRVTTGRPGPPTPPLAESIGKTSRNGPSTRPSAGSGHGVEPARLEEIYGSAMEWSSGVAALEEQQGDGGLASSADEASRSSWALGSGGLASSAGEATSRSSRAVVDPGGGADWRRDKRRPAREGSAGSGCTRQGIHSHFSAIRRSAYSRGRVDLEDIIWDPSTKKVGSCFFSLFFAFRLSVKFVDITAVNDMWYSRRKTSCSTCLLFCCLCVVRGFSGRLY